MACREKLPLEMIVDVVEQLVQAAERIRKCEKGEEVDNYQTVVHYRATPATRKIT